MASDGERKDKVAHLSSHYVLGAASALLIVHFALHCRHRAASVYAPGPAEV